MGYEINIYDRQHKTLPAGKYVRWLGREIGRLSFMVPVAKAAVAFIPTLHGRSVPKNAVLRLKFF